MKSMMIDIETFSTHSDAAVVSIGAVTFDNENILDSFYAAMLPAHGHIDVNTVLWWLKQSDKAREALSNVSRMEEDEAAGKFLAFVTNAKAEEIWANSPNFDLTILENWWIRTVPANHKVKWPISFRLYRDMRTLRKLAAELDMSVDRNEPETSHNALSDATAQARYVMAQKKLFREK